MSTKHTPGPWVPHPQGDASEWCMLTNDKRWVIAFRFNGEITLPEERANARLIAAAPELLEACSNAAVNLEDFCSDEPEFEWTIEAGKSIARMLRAAIAKAEGKEAK